MKTLEYGGCRQEDVEVGGLYYLGQLWSKAMGGEPELILMNGELEAPDSTAVEFRVVRTKEYILDTLVKVTGIY